MPHNPCNSQANTNQVPRKLTLRATRPLDLCQQETYSEPNQSPESRPTCNKIWFTKKPHTHHCGLWPDHKGIHVCSECEEIGDTYISNPFEEQSRDWKNWWYNNKFTETTNISDLKEPELCDDCGGPLNIVEQIRQEIQDRRQYLFDHLDTLDKDEKDLDKEPTKEVLERYEDYIIDTEFGR